MTSQRCCRKKVICGWEGRGWAEKSIDVGSRWGLAHRSWVQAWEGIIKASAQLEAILQNQIKKSLCLFFGQLARSCQIWVWWGDFMPRIFPEQFKIKKIPDLRIRNQKWRVWIFICLFVYFFFNFFFLNSKAICPFSGVSMIKWMNWW